MAVQGLLRQDFETRNGRTRTAVGFTVSRVWLVGEFQNRVNASGWGRRDVNAAPSQVIHMLGCGCSLALWSVLLLRRGGTRCKCSVGGEIGRG